MAQGSVPGPGISIDGLSKTKGQAIVIRVDWDELLREFCTQPDYTLVRTWLREVKKWPESKVNSGFTRENIVGWGKHRAEYRRSVHQEALERAREVQASMAPELLKAKLELVKQVIGQAGRWTKLHPSEQKLVYDILKIELGEPTSIKVQANVGDDPVKELLRQYNIIKDEVIVDVEAEDFRDSQEPVAIDGGTSQN